MLLGAVDLGSNSFRVEIGRVDGDRIVTQSYWKETIRMAAGFDKNGALTPEMQAKALAALSRFHEKLAGLPPPRSAPSAPKLCVKQPTLPIFFPRRKQRSATPSAF